MVLSDVAQTFFNGNPDYFEDKIREFMGRFGMDAGDIKDLSVAALITRMITMEDDETIKGELRQLLNMAKQSGISSSVTSALKLGGSATATS